MSKVIRRLNVSFVVSIVSMFSIMFGAMLIDTI